MSTYYLMHGELHCSDELYHFGIKGQKWGVRRFQKKDGSLTSAGKKRYNDENQNGVKKKSKHRLKLEESYRQKGMSKSEAEVAAAKRIKTEKILVATAAVTVAAASAYVIRKNIKERSDTIIKSGTKLQRVTNNPAFNPDNAIYSSFKNSDNTKYKGLYGMQLEGHAHKITLNANSDVKVASRKKAVDAFVDLYKNDLSFRESFKKSNESLETFGMVPKRDKIIRKAAKDMTDKQLKKIGYDAFNVGLANHSPEGNEIAKKFYDKLKSQGYDAVMDINDQKYSGYKAKAPVIVFNAAKKLSVDKVEEMTRKQILSNTKKAMVQVLAPEAVKYGAAFTATKLGSNQLHKKANSIAVNKYRKSHPNTKLSDDEILEMLTK